MNNWITDLVSSVGLAVLADQLKNGKLQELVKAGDEREDLLQVLDGQRTVDVAKDNKSVSAAGHVSLAGQEGLNDLGGIGEQVIKVTVNGANRKDGILAHIRVAVFLSYGAKYRRYVSAPEEVRVKGNTRTYQTRAHTLNQRLKHFGLANLAQETQGRTTNVLIGVLQVVSQRIAAEGWRQFARYGLGLLCFCVVVTYQTRMNSSLSLPSGLVLGQISQ